jgi:hypothetical protein
MAIRTGGRADGEESVGGFFPYLVQGHAVIQKAAGEDGSGDGGAARKASNAMDQDWFLTGGINELPNLIGLDFRHDDPTTTRLNDFGIIKVPRLNGFGPAHLEAGTGGITNRDDIPKVGIKVEEALNFSERTDGEVAVERGEDHAKSLA